MNHCWTKKKWLRIDVGEGCIIPHWYGVAYMDYVSNRVICYPIPFNWLVKWGRTIYNKLSFPNISTGEYTKGFSDGVKSARDYAYKEGYIKGLEDGRNQKEDFTSIH